MIPSPLSQIYLLFCRLSTQGFRVKNGWRVRTRNRAESYGISRHDLNLSMSEAPNGESVRRYADVLQEHRAVGQRGVPQPLFSDSEKPRELQINVQKEQIQIE